MAIEGLKVRCPWSKVHTLKVTAPAGGYTQGQMTTAGDVVAIAVETAAAAAEVAMIYKAEKIVVPCVAVTSGSFTIGSKVYYDAADAEVNESASGNTLCGIVTKVPSTGDEEVEIEFDGTLGIVS